MEYTIEEKTLVGLFIYGAKSNPSKKVDCFSCKRQSKTDAEIAEDVRNFLTGKSNKSESISDFLFGIEDLEATYGAEISVRSYIYKMHNQNHLFNATLNPKKLIDNHTYRTLSEHLIRFFKIEVNNGLQQDGRHEFIGKSVLEHVKKRDYIRCFPFQLKELRGKDKEIYGRIVSTHLDQILESEYRHDFSKEIDFAKKSNRALKKMLEKALEKEKKGEKR